MVVLSQSLISPSSGKLYSDPEAVPPDLVHNSSLHLTFAKYDSKTHTCSKYSLLYSRVAVVVVNVTRKNTTVSKS